MGVSTYCSGSSALCSISIENTLLPQTHNGHDTNLDPRVAQGANLPPSTAPEGKPILPPIFNKDYRKVGLKDPEQLKRTLIIIL